VTAGDVPGMDRERSLRRVFLKTTVGQKVIMGITGAVLTLFVIGHVLGNLLVFRGRSELNRYSSLLHASSELLWSVRAVLVASVLVHVLAAWWLTREAHAARPIGYTKKVPQAATWASRTMRWGGLLIAFFVVVHVLHLTTGTIRPVPFSETDVYSNVVGAFRVPWVAAFYLVAMIVLGLHLFHGVWAAFRSTGVSRPTAEPLRRRLATIVALCVWAGFTAIPLGVRLGIVR
jgi:succinate dehydrogenase / fumarate reductase, cytochrome b subunit